MPRAQKRPGQKARKAPREPKTPEQLAKCAEPIAEYLADVLQEEDRLPYERVQAALGLRALQDFIPSLSISPDGPETNLPRSDIPAKRASNVPGFDALTAAEEEVVARAAALVGNFITVNAQRLPAESTVLISMDLAATLIAAASRHGQDMMIEQLGAEAAKQRMQDLILQRSQELMRGHDLALN